MFRSIKSCFAIVVATMILTGCIRYTESDTTDTFSIPDLNDSITHDESQSLPAKRDTLSLRSDREEMYRYISESEYSSEYQKGILPDMIRDVPKYAIKLLMNHHDGFLIVDKATMKIYRYNKYGVLQESVGMACSKNYGTKHARRDNRTPEGFFSIEGKYDSTDWLYTDDDGNVSDIKGQFGPRFMRLKVPNTSQIGIHGTCAPWSIGGRRSHGCIRVTNENILRLFDIVQVGWPVIVSPGRKDFMVNSEEGYDIPTVPVIPGKPRASYTYRPSNENVNTNIQNSERVTDTVSKTVISTDTVKSMSHTDTIHSL